MLVDLTTLDMKIYLIYPVRGKIYPEFDSDGICPTPLRRYLIDENDCVYHFYVLLEIGL